MKKTTVIILFAIIIVSLVWMVVMKNGNQQTTSNVNRNSSVTLPVNESKASVENVGSAQSGSESGSVGLDVLKTHNKQEDCWIGFEGKVYDISLWLPRHPGSAGAIAPYCGTSGEFEKAFVDKHGRSQVEKLIEEGVFKGELK